MADSHPTRAFLPNAHRIIVKVGTAVVSREVDGRLAIGRLGALFEQIEGLLRKGKEVILVTSGAVGVGRQKLRHQKLMSSSMKDLEEARSMEVDNKACASIGQSGLMALYDALFGQLDVACSQLLVTDSDFRNPDFRKQLRFTVDSLLKNKVIPVFNENDAISTRTAPYKDSTGIFWDNDSLAALLSLELKVDALVLMSDVDGLYTGPPSKPTSKIIHTYLKEKHDEMVTFGEKSRVGRGGMIAKVEAAWMAASAGVPVIIASGYIPNNLLNVMEGKLIGTLFHKDAPNWETKKNETSRTMALSAREASRKLQAMPSSARKKILYDIATALEAHENEIIEENNADVRNAEINGVSPSLLQRLKLKPGKISQLAQGIRSIAAMEEPIGETLKMTELAEGLVLEKITWPLGVLLVIFEARPDALPQIASLAIRSGNGLLLKGGKEAVKSNAVIHRVITDAIPPSVGKGLIGLITTREEISDLLKLDDVIDLVIPRGSNELVSHIKQNTKIAVLGHADGVCHVYVDEDVDYDMTLKIVLDAKLDYPAACNAVVTIPFTFISFSFIPIPLTSFHVSIPTPLSIPPSLSISFILCNRYHFPFSFISPPSLFPTPSPSPSLSLRLSLFPLSCIYILSLTLRLYSSPTLSFSPASISLPFRPFISFVNSIIALFLFFSFPSFLNFFLLYDFLLFYLH